VRGEQRQQCDLAFDERCCDAAPREAKDDPSVDEERGVVPAAAERFDRCAAEGRKLRGDERLRSGASIAISARQT
jgi:hypothetical protein